MHMVPRAFLTSVLQSIKPSVSPAPWTVEPLKLWARDCFECDCEKMFFNYQIIISTGHFDFSPSLHLTCK